MLTAIEFSIQGYLVGDDEIQLSFNDFRAQYGGSGAVEYVDKSSGHGE